MAAMEDRRRPLADLEHGSLPDPVFKAVMSVLKEQDKLEERLRVLESASGIASPEDESREKIMIEAVQPGREEYEI
jgi:hypothetical protein